MRVRGPNNVGRAVQLIRHKGLYDLRRRRQRKTSPQNITFHYRKFLAVRPSRSRRTMWVKYPKNKLARAV